LAVIITEVKTGTVNRI